jgi:hypothetical protein
LFLPWEFKQASFETELIDFNGSAHFHKMCQEIYFANFPSGFLPWNHGPFVSAKGPKTIGARRGSGGSLRFSLNSAIAQLAWLKQCLSFS